MSRHGTASAFERGQRVALRAALCVFSTRSVCSRECVARASGALRAELEAIARRDEQVTAAFKALLGPEADRELATLPREERDAVLVLWERLGDAMSAAGRARIGAV